MLELYNVRKMIEEAETRIENIEQELKKTEVPEFKGISDPGDIKRLIGNIQAQRERLRRELETQKLTLAGLQKALPNAQAAHDQRLASEKKREEQLLRRDIERMEKALKEKKELAAK